MSDCAAACARGRAGPSRAGEAGRSQYLGVLPSPMTPIRQRYPSVIRVRGVGNHLIKAGEWRLPAPAGTLRARAGERGHHIPAGGRAAIVFAAAGVSILGAHAGRHYRARGIPPPSRLLKRHGSRAETTRVDPAARNATCRKLFRAKLETDSSVTRSTSGE